MQRPQTAIRADAPDAHEGAFSRFHDYEATKSPSDL